MATEALIAAVIHCVKTVNSALAVFILRMYPVSVNRMDNMICQTKNVSRTYFRKESLTTIDDVRIGDVVFIEIWSPLSYGIRKMSYFGKITKVTKCFFWIIPYVDGHGFGPNPACYVNTDVAARMDKAVARYTKQWAKSRLIEIRSASTYERIDAVTIYNPRS